MLTQHDLSQIKSMFDAQTKIIRGDIMIEVKREIKEEMKKEHRRTRAVMNEFIGFFDQRVNRCERRLDRVETTLKLPSLGN